MQMLVFVVLAASWGIYSLVKARAKQFGEQERNWPAGVRNPQSRVRWQIKRLKELNLTSSNESENVEEAEES